MKLELAYSLVVIGAVLIYLNYSNESILENKFNLFLSEYNKNYKSYDEYQMRLKIFEKKFEYY